MTIIITTRLLSCVCGGGRAVVRAVTICPTICFVYLAGAASVVNSQYALLCNTNVNCTSGHVYRHHICPAGESISESATKFRARRLLRSCGRLNPAAVVAATCDNNQLGKKLRRRTSTLVIINTEEVRKLEFNATKYYDSCTLCYNIYWMYRCGADKSISVSISDHTTWRGPHRWQNHFYIL